MPTQPLPSELISLIHHVELNKAGWWDKAIQHLIVSVIWESNENLQAADILNALRSKYRVTMDGNKLKGQLDKLCSSGAIICMPNGLFRVSEDFTRRFKQDLQEAEEIEQSTEMEFVTLLQECCPSLDASRTWKEFNEEFLLPFVNEFGANTYRLLSLGRPHLDTDRFRRFVSKYPEEIRESFGSVAEKFLNFGNPKVRSYLLRTLNAFFLIEATSLKESTLNSLSKQGATRPVFNLFLDTNYLFSVLDLVATPEEDSYSIVDLVAQLKDRLNIKLYVLPNTIDEARRVLISIKQNLSGMRLLPNLAQAALRTKVGPIQIKYFEVVAKRGAISVDDYFNPFIDDFTSVMRAKGVELFNEDTGKYKMSQDVIDDIVSRLELEKRKYRDDAKTYEQLEHDMILWQFVKLRRPLELDSPLDAKNWVVTLDYRLLGFDEFKKRANKIKLSVCLHPAILMQMLQFWIPRTHEFESAMLDAMRLPFFSQYYNRETERVTMDIIRTLGRFEDVGDLEADTISSILVNGALRQTISTERDEEEKINLVRDALIQQHDETKQKLVEATQEAERLKKEMAERGERNLALSATLQAKERQLDALESRVSTIQEQSNSEKSVLEGRIRQLEEGLRAREEAERAREEAEQARKEVERIREERRRFIVNWVGLPLLIAVVVGAGIAIWVSRATNLHFWTVAVFCWLSSLIALVWVVDRQGATRPSITNSKTYKLLHSLKVILSIVLGAVWVLVSGALGNGLWDWVKQ
jgi:hypothetical protein